MYKASLLALAACLVGFVSQASVVLGEDPNTPPIPQPPARQRFPPGGQNDPNAAGPLIGPWLHLPNLPESKEQFGFEACAGKLYAVAGIHNGEETGSSFVYDTNSGQWQPIAPLPREVQSICLRAVKGRLFSFGGYHHGFAIKHSDVWLYDPVADAWLPRSPMPVAREDAGSGVVNGQVWIIGGLTNPGHQLVPQIDVYDPDLDAWVMSFAIKPHDEDWPGRALGDFACAANGAIWCLAGTETTEGYPFLRPEPLGFFATETDIGYVPIPDPRCYAELEVIGGDLFVVGGCRTSTWDYADTMLILDLKTQTWKEPVLLPYGARGQGVCSWNGALYVAGGYDGRTRDNFCMWMGDDAK
jgi:N-acetylneuraminic acid mutarotase